MEKDAAEYSTVLRDMLRDEFAVFRDTIKTELGTEIRCIFRESKHQHAKPLAPTSPSTLGSPDGLRIFGDEGLPQYEPHEWMTRHVRTFAAHQVVEDEMVRIASNKTDDGRASSCSNASQGSQDVQSRKSQVSPLPSEQGAGQQGNLFAANSPRHGRDEAKGLSQASLVVPTQLAHGAPESRSNFLPGQSGTDEDVATAKSFFAKKDATNHSNRKRSFALAAVRLADAASPYSDEKTCRGVVTRLMLHPCFELASMSLIFLNAVQIGVQTHEMAISHNTDTPQHHRVLEIIFACFFTLELCIRLYVHRLSFFYMRGWAWNLFDLMLVSLQLTLWPDDPYDPWLEEIFMGVRGSQLDGIASSFLLRTARLLRTIRVLRILKMALTIEDLRFFVNCLISSGSAFFWSLILLSIMTYIASVYVTQMVLMERPEAKWSAKVEEELSFYFGSVPRAWLSVFEGLSGGLDWDVLAGPLFRDVSPVVGWVFLLFQAFSLLAVMNVVTATFIESALRRAESARVSMQIARAYRLFKALDVDSSGTIGFDEINDHLETAPVLEFFQDLNVHPLEAKFLFQMLDINNSGTIDFEEFLNGCIRLQGNAKALDMLLVTYDLRTAFQRNSKILHELLERVKILTDNGVYKNEEPVSA
eukprot:TRINITY_DN12974_c0_g1_i2.p1 TRINITY_DN12974_c0_g1~~TRINITY_DN12974_c0_g1_i2.p1  ORF type:complete len:644 (-),score=92.96 TRINITY_DN12974_c0_g1_i2:24-1955(-)